MTPSELAAELRTRINPVYAAQLGTESYERRLCAEAIEGLEAELAALKGRQLKSFAKLYADNAQGIEIERLKMELEKAQERKPLTRQRILEILDDEMDSNDEAFLKFARAIEAAHGIKEQP